jgi:predicted alpha/beta hydrolase family esterase
MTTALSAFDVLLVPGLHDSGPRHWQTRWQRRNPAFARVVQDDWDTPDLARWSLRLQASLRVLDRPVLLVAHSFGCLASARALSSAGQVAGALLVAPADPEKFGVTGQLPAAVLPCPTILISSRNDPWLSEPRAELLARTWGCLLVRGGMLGHINAESELGDWHFGQAKLRQLAALAS